MYFVGYQLDIYLFNHDLTVGNNEIWIYRDISILYSGARPLQVIVNGQKVISFAIIWYHELDLIVCFSTDTISPGNPFLVHFNTHDRSYYLIPDPLRPLFFSSLISATAHIFRSYSLPFVNLTDWLFAPKKLSPLVQVEQSNFVLLHFCQELTLYLFLSVQVGNFLYAEKELILEAFWECLHSGFYRRGPLKIGFILWVTKPSVYSSK